MIKPSFYFPLKLRHIRHITLDGERWYAAHDICEQLDIPQARHAVRESCERSEYRYVSWADAAANDAVFPSRGMVCVNESGLHRLIFRSRKRSVLQFRLWLTSTVIPDACRMLGFLA